MTDSRHQTALCAVVHPGALPFLPAWCSSVARQTDQSFDLCVALDGVTEAELPELPGAGRRLRVVRPAPSSSPVKVRNALFGEVVESHEFVVAVDADDVLAPQRIAFAKQDVERADLAACAMELIDHAGVSLGRRFGALADASSDALARLLPRANVFGLSNTA
ncbi:MAG TPA: glycosyltransferase family A protein, partial [Thermoleophilia bacterium]